MRRGAVTVRALAAAALALAALAGAACGTPATPAPPEVPSVTTAAPVPSASAEPSTAVALANRDMRAFAERDWPALYATLLPADRETLSSSAWAAVCEEQERLAGRVVEFRVGAARPIDADGEVLGVNVSVLFAGSSAERETMLFYVADETGRMWRSTLQGRRIASVR